MTDVKFDFSGKNFVVVGASSGMGWQIAIDLATAGANVLAIARNKERLEKLQAECPGKIVIFSLDVISANSEEWDACIGDFVRVYGKISGGVYTAGITGVSPLKGFNEKLAHDIMDTSFWGMINFIHAGVRKKYANTGASYVVFSSTAGHQGSKGMFAYSAAKAAVKTAVQSIAEEIAQTGKRINSISPGWVNTHMTLDSVQNNTEAIPQHVLKRHYLGLGEPTDVSGTALFLLSDASRWITGTDILVDGGYLSADG